MPDRLKLQERPLIIGVAFWLSDCRCSQQGCCARRGLSRGLREPRGSGGQGRAGQSPLPALPAPRRRSHNAAAPAHAGTRTETPAHAGTHTAQALPGPRRSRTRPRSRTHGRRPPGTNLPPSYIPFTSLGFLCRPSSARLPLLLQRGHICLQTLLGRNQPVQNKDSRGCLHLGTRQPVAIFKLARSPPLRAPCSVSPSLSPLCLSSYCTTRINYSLLVSRFPGKTNHRWSLANGLMPYLPTGYLCSSYNPLETIKRIRLSFKTSHVREQT